MEASGEQKVEPKTEQPEPLDDNDQGDQQDEDEWVRDMWIWERLLSRIRRNISYLEKRLDKNLLIHHDVESTMNRFQRLRQRGQRNEAIQPAQMARVIKLMAKALNRLDELAVNMANYSKDFNRIRRNLRLLEEKLNRDVYDEGLGDEDEDPIKVALEYMSHVDEILNRIARWEEDEGHQ